MNKQNQSLDIEDDTLDENRDPLTGAPGSHPVGTGVGAAGGAAAGAALGAIAGPVGVAVGVVAGALAGGLAGKSVAESIDPTAEDAYWRANYTNRPYVDRNTAYDEYAAAFRTGYEGRGRYDGRSFEEAESDLERDYAKYRGPSQLTWTKARQASRDAWHRVENVLPGDADRDGR